MNPTPITEEARKAALNVADEICIAHDLPLVASFERHIQSAIDQACAAKDAEIAELRSLTVPVCSACAGTAPDSQCRCICGGAGTQEAELQGFRNLAYDQQSELESLRAQLSELEKDKQTLRCDLQSASEREYALKKDLGIAEKTNHTASWMATGAALIDLAYSTPELNYLTSGTGHQIAVAVQELLLKDRRRIETLQAAADAVKDAEGNVTHLKLTIPDGNDVRKTLDSLGSAISAQQGKGEA